MTDLATLSIDESLLVSFLLASVRIGTWLFIAPPFGRIIPARVRGALAFGLALPMASVTEVALPSGIVQLAAAALFQAAIGLATGFIVLAFISVFSVAGAFVDFSGGFSMGAMFDPLSGSSAAIISRAYTMLATVLIFATGGHIVLVGGFMRTFQSAPLQGPSIEALGQLAIDNIGWLFLAALEIAFPIVAVLFLVELVLGLVARAAPQTNVLTIGFALKIGVAILAIAASIPLLPAAVETLVTAAVGAAS
ncbi:MAG: flagellar biosynthetic protein FliR [Ilumatobacteraceae bacterium]